MYNDVSIETLAQEDQREQELDRAFMVFEAYNGSVIKRLKSIRRDAIQRCSNPKTTSYRWYGAKGVEVCQKWREDNSMFVEYVLHNHPKTFWLQSGKGKSRRYFHIDRVDADKGYQPGNIRFISKEKNCSRKRNPGPHRNLTKADVGLIVTLRVDNGLSRKEIAERIGVSRQVVSYHLRKHLRTYGL